MSDELVILVFPHSDGSWSWSKSDEISGDPLRYDTRAEALFAARKANGRVVNEVFNEGGEKVGHTIVDGELRVLMLRLDGSVYAEIDAPRSPDSAPPKRARLVPANSETQVNPNG